MKEYIKIEILSGEKFNLFNLIKLLSFNLKLRFIFMTRLMYWSNKKRYRLLAGYISRKLITKYGCFIGYQSRIGLGVKFPHPNGIIIGANTVIGDNCTIYQQVTFGGKEVGDASKGQYPAVGNNVIIFSGAKLIGGINVGDNVVIGANSVVNKDIPSFSVVAGVPAKIIRTIPH